MMWGRWKENGVWLAKSSHRRLIVRRTHFYAAIGRLRVRLMSPLRNTEGLK